ncbi:hypothetical protein HY495_02940 [Candidatus Woesearchaeota archaeon]|nr:hypothetical protein [Candidatus Woesearchaeota archaeon]
MDKKYHDDLFNEINDYLPKVLRELAKLKYNYQVYGVALARPIAEICEDIKLFSKRWEELLAFEQLTKENVPLIANFANRLILLLQELNQTEQQLKEVEDRYNRYRRGDEVAYEASRINLKTYLKRNIDRSKLKTFLKSLERLAAECKTTRKVEATEIALTIRARAIIKTKSWGVFDSPKTLDQISRRVWNSFKKQEKKLFGGSGTFSRIVASVQPYVSNMGRPSLSNMNYFIHLLPQIIALLEQEDHEQKIVELMLQQHQKNLIEVENSLNNTAKMVARLIEGIEKSKINVYYHLVDYHQQISSTIANLRSAIQAYVKGSAGALTVISEKGNLSLSTAGHLSEHKG